jgi:hypothetical protein
MYNRRNIDIEGVKNTRMGGGVELCFGSFKNSSKLDNLSDSAADKR